MTVGLVKCRKIHHIVSLKQMLRRWRNKARLSSLSRCVPSDVPSGHVAVCVGSSCRRFIVRAVYLNHPILSDLLVQAEEEYGFENQGPLVIPCEESAFEEAIRFISRFHSSRSSRFTCPEDLQKCHGGINRMLIESRPLLHGVIEKVVW
ncbi:SAUR-like auxin-responsive protein family [Raphanus sativus]|uniref:Protein SMALL AUXIN UP-REGULATED RNA 12-like n=1 Tax=Raphanus sativus TaxID=3726 RepID=A0A6J0JTK5_RAPSA|nr:protein SMALL AUXIN UP-REGULATED RNA 12-like [Raphanus sativus]KAJ4889511.1 SAUR-like auxin-responsive protein family [Raphanus sativus]